MNQVTHSPTSTTEAGLRNTRQNTFGWTKVYVIECDIRIVRMKLHWGHNGCVRGGVRRKPRYWVLVAGVHGREKDLEGRERYQRIFSVRCLWWNVWWKKKVWPLVKPELLKVQGAGVGKGRITIENWITQQDLCKSRAKAAKDGCSPRLITFSYT